MSKYLERVYVDIAGLIPVTSVGGCDYLHIVVNDFARMVYTRPLHLKSEAVYLSPLDGQLWIVSSATMSFVQMSGNQVCK